MARREGWLEGVAVIRESDRIGREAVELEVDPRAHGPGGRRRGAGAPRHLTAGG